MPAASSLRRLVLLFLTLSFATPVVRAQDSALLLGIRSTDRVLQPVPYYSGGGDSLARPVYSTLLISRRGNEFVASPRPLGLYVPRKEGFWRVDTKRSVYNDWVEDFLWSAPVGKSPQLPGIPAYNGEYCQGHRTQNVNFASADFLAVEVLSAGYCEDAAHPWSFKTLAVIPIDSTDHLGVPVSRFYGAAGRGALNTAAETALARLKTSERERFVARPDEASWNIARHNGRWTLRGRLDPSAVTRTDVLDFPVELRSLAPLVPRNTLAVEWATVRAFSPNARDAFSSPAGDWLAILHPGRLTIHRITEGRIGPTMLTQVVPNDARAVMIRWSGNAAEARRWSSQLPAR